jgi:hypothetical protein
MVADAVSDDPLEQIPKQSAAHRHTVIRLHTGAEQSHQGTVNTCGLWHLDCIPMRLPRSAHESQGDARVQLADHH